MPQDAVEASNNEPEAPFQHKFEFINSKDKSARKKSRTHITKEYYRERRYTQSHAHRSNAIPFIQKIQEPQKPKFVVSVTKLGALDGHRVLREDTAVDLPSVACSLQVSNGAEDQACSQHQIPKSSVVATYSSLRSLLGAGRVDPFQTYPVEATWTSHQLVDHCQPQPLDLHSQTECSVTDFLLRTDHFVIPSLLHKHWGRRINHPMPIMDLFEVYRQDALSFLGMLHHAAHHLANMRGVVCTGPTEAIDFKYRTLKLLNQRLRSSTGPYDDGVIVAVGLLVNAEVSPEDDSTHRLHS